MANNWTERWNERYRHQEYAYGESPNLFLKEQLEKLKPGKILFPAEGEGRNAVFAAKLGWTVDAFDISIEGQKKAMQLAQKNNVSIDYQVGDLQKLNFKEQEFDAIALIYAHFPPEIRSEYHKKFDTFLRKNGIIILEAFSKKHIDYVGRNPNVGGPKDIESLFSIEEIKRDFKNYDIIKLEETEVNLNEGTHHKGLGSVIRFVGRKK
jgi:SAM-dependent methyltransferase